MAISIQSISAKLQNGDSTTPTAGDLIVSCGAGRASSTGRTITAHTLAGAAYTAGLFLPVVPGSTNVYGYADHNLTVPTVSSAESLTWSAGMITSADGDSVLYSVSGADQTTPYTGGDGNAFTSTTTPGAITLPAVASGDLILYWIAFNTGNISSGPSGYTLDVTAEMANLSQGRWYSKISDGTETTVAATLTASATGAHFVAVYKASAGGGGGFIPAFAVNSNVII